MQIYGNFLKYVFIFSFFMFKMRELTQNQHKITAFKHFNA